MLELMRERERLANRRQGLVGIAEKPEVMGREAPAYDSRVLRVQHGQGAMALGVPEGDPLRAVLTGTDEISHEVTMGPKRAMGGDQERRVLSVVGEPQQLRRQVLRRLQVGPDEIEAPEGPEDRAESRRLSQLLTQLPSARVSLSHLEGG